MGKGEVKEDVDHNENGDIQLPQSSNSPPRRRSSSETLEKPYFTGVQWSRNGARGSIMSARFSESSNDSFVFGEVEINGRQADNMLEVNVRIRLDQLRPAHWPENDEDDPELVLIENEREVEEMIFEFEYSTPDTDDHFDNSDASTETDENENIWDVETVERSEPESDTEAEESDDVKVEVKPEESDGVNVEVKLEESDGVKGEVKLEPGDKEEYQNCEKAEGEEESNKEDESEKFEISNEKKIKVSDSPQPSCSKQDNALSDIQMIRKRNRELIMAALEETKDPEMEAELGRMKDTFLFSCEEPPKKNTGRKRKREDDETVRFDVKVPLERRRSARLRKETPEYNENSLDTIEGNLSAIDKHVSDDDDSNSEFKSMEEVIYKPRPRQSKAQSAENKYMISVEDVTQEMLDNILKASGKKQHSAAGTTCHQCRQKTIDQKTSCRNPECIGFRGLFCGVCLKTRYGEDCAEALLDPDWLCPPCRGRCNCSICRTREGKRPTGVLYPIAASSGYQSVDHFLVGLKGKGDKVEDDGFKKEAALNKSPKAFLGFSDNGRKAHLQDGTVESIDCIVCDIKERNNPENLLGFNSDGAAVMGGNEVVPPLFQPKD